MIGIENVEKTRELLQQKLDSSNFASKHHAKIMQQLNDMGFTPNPIQKIVVAEELYQDLSTQFEKKTDNQTQRHNFS